MQPVLDAHLDEVALIEHAEQSPVRYQMPNAWIQVPKVRRSLVPLERKELHHDGSDQ
jgi:hypothetical protein